MKQQNSTENHNYEKPVSTRLTPQTKRQFDDWRDTHELSDAQALRRLTRQALDDSRPTLQVSMLSLGFAYIVAYVLAGPSGGSAVGGVGIITGLLYSFFPTLRRLV